MYHSLKLNLKTRVQFTGHRRVGQQKRSLGSLPLVLEALR